MKLDRISWIDVARGIGILLVIYGHGLNAHSYRYLIYAFHMPLFFFLSGLVFRKKEDESFLVFIKKSAKNLLAPYLFFSFLSISFWIALNYQELTLDVIAQQTLSIFYGNGTNGWLAFNTVLWFLPCLFITRVSFWFITRIFQKPMTLGVMLFGISLLGFGLSHFFPTLKLFFGIETALNAIVFFGLGYLWNYLPERIAQTIQKHSIVSFCLIFNIFLLTAHLTYSFYGLQIDMRANRLHDYGLFYIASLTGIIATLMVSQKFGTNKLLSYLGKNTVSLFVWHLIVFSLITRIFRLFLTPQAIDNLRNLYFAPLYTVLSICIILGLKYVYKKLT